MKRTMPFPQSTAPDATTLWAELGRCTAAALLALASFYPLYVVLAASLRALASPFGQTAWPAMPDWSLASAVLARAASHLESLTWCPSLTVPTVAIAVALFLGVTADYAFGPAWLGPRSRLLVVLGLTLFPELATLAGMFDLMRDLRVYNHWWGLATPYLVFTLPFAVWAVMGCTDRAAAGRGHFWRALRPALLATALVAYIAAWNEFMYTLVPILDATQEAPPAPDSVRATSDLAVVAWLGLLAVGMLAACTFDARARRRDARLETLRRG